MIKDTVDVCCHQRVLCVQDSCLWLESSAVFSKIERYQMEYKIQPLAITQVEWRTYIKFVEDVLGCNPTRGLGSTIIELDTPAAYLATLDLENRPMNQLSQGAFINNTFDHLHVSFIAELDTDVLHTVLTTFPNLDYITKKAKKTYLVIISAKMSVWYPTIIKALKSFQEKEIRQIFQIILIWFDNLGFKDVWSEYDRKLYIDGTIILQR